jgi:DNA-binding transcriptional LysR family regulator
LDLRLDWLESYVHFAEALNFTRAARKAGVSQPALHTRIGQLQSWAGEPLYVRQGRGLALTARGEEVLRLARAVTAEVARFQSPDRPDPIVVSAGRGTHLYLLADPLRRWVDEGGALRLRSEVGDEAVRSVLEGRAHLAVAPLPRPHPRLRSAPFRKAGIHALLRASDPLARRTSLSLADLAGRDLLLPPRERPLRDAVDRAFASREIEPVVAVELEGWDLLVHYALLGVGIALVNDYVPVPDGAAGVPVPELPVVELRIVVRRDASGAARALFDRLVR